MSLFQVNGKMNLLCGGKFSEVSLQTGSLLKSSWLSLPLGLRRFFFCPEINISGFFGHAIFEKVTKYEEMHTFPTWACPKNPDMSISGKKAAGGPAAETARSFSEDTLSEDLPLKTYLHKINSFSH